VQHFATANIAGAAVFAPLTQVGSAREYRMSERLLLLDLSVT